jgi:hypothetical protein
VRKSHTTPALSEELSLTMMMRCDENGGSKREDDNTLEGRGKERKR